MARRAINPEGIATPTPISEDSESPSGYNVCIVEGGTFHMAGQVARDVDGTVVGPNDVVAQGLKVFENVGFILDEIGKGFDDVTKVKSYFTDIDRHLIPYKEEVWAEVFDEGRYPCHTGIGVDRLSHPDFLLEVEVDVPVHDVPVE